MDYSRKLAYQSNYWYNDGLQKANIRDMSGAITSLKKSLQFNRENVAARNLLGLVYYGIGEIAEALVEWIISKNLKSSENVANYFITKVQENPGELETANQALHKFNQCLVYCRQNGEDLAVIQLKKIVAEHSTFLKAYQLLALLYLKTEQHAKAKQVLRKAHKLDKTNDITLLYMHELTQNNRKKPVRKKEPKETAITYTLGNETIIQPVPSALKEGSPLATLVNIVIGLVVGAAVVWFLIVPATNQLKSAETNKEILAYSDQLEAKDGQISALKKELEVYRATNAAGEEAAEAQATAKESYEALITVSDQYQSGSASDADMVDSLLKINQETLGEKGKEFFTSITQEVYPRACEKKFKTGKANYEAEDYQGAIEVLTQVTAMDESYEEGQALLILADSYAKTEDAEKAKTLYNRVIELQPNTEAAAAADKAIKGDTKDENE